MRRGIMVVILLAVAVAAAAVVWSRWPARQDPNTIVLSGNIELTEVDVGFPTAGRIVELPVQEGMPVKKGALIARIDQEPSRRQRSRELASVAAAEAQLGQTRTAITWQRETVARDVDLRRAEIAQAEARLAELQAGPRPQEVQQARAVVEEAGTQHQQARQDWERAQVLFQNEDISAAQRDQARARFDATAAGLRRAQQQLAVLEEGTRREQIAAGRAQVDRARAALRMSEANRLEIQRREQELEARHADADRARAQLGIAESQFNNTTANAAIDGVVLVKSAEVGEVVAPGRAVATLGDIERPWVRGYIGERHLGRVKLGDSVEVRTDSYPGKVYPGRLSFIASEAEFTPKQIQTPEERVKLVYRVKIEVANPHRELKNNMPVEAIVRLRPAE